jgi:agmatine deiminase
MKIHLPYFILPFLFAFSFFTPSFGQVAVFNPAEFEKNEGVMLVWDYSSSRDSITANIAKAAQQAGKVWIIYYPGQAPIDTTQIRQYLYSRGVLPLNLYFIPSYTETLWIRDFGPMTLYGNFGQGNERFILDMGYSAYNRPKDDSLPRQISNLWGWKLRDLELEIEGGNLIFDGLKRGFASTRVYEQNPAYSPAMIRNILIDKFNLHDFTFLQSLNNSGGGIWKHVDMFMKVLDYETILVSSYPDHLPDYPVIEANVEILRNLTNAFGKPYEIIRIPAPPKANGTWATTQNDEMRTYTNSLIINNTVIVPSYGLPEYDLQAKQIYTNAMPGYKIIMVDAQMLTPLGGAIHCITKEVPAPHLVRIRHRKVTGLQQFSPEIYIYSNCESTASLQQMWLYYKKNLEDQYTQVPVYMACPENIGIIEGLQPGDKVSYYLEAVSAFGTVTYPLSAPAGNFSFYFDEAVGEAENYVNDTRNELLILPQPNKGSFYLRARGGEKLEKVKIYDASGRIVFDAIYNESQQLSPGLKSGFYIVHAETLKGLKKSKMIVTD